MNQRKMWIAVTLFAAIVGSPSIGRSQIKRGETTSYKLLAAINTVKIGGEYKSQGFNSISKEVIAKFQIYKFEGRQATNLFVHNIPVVTFLGSELTDSNGKKMVVTIRQEWENFQDFAREKSLKVVADEINNSPVYFGNHIPPNSKAPVIRASILASSLNQLNQRNIDVNKITVNSKDTRKSSMFRKHANGILESYVARMNDIELVDINKDSRSPDTIKNLGQDLIYVANHLPRLMSSMSSLKGIDSSQVVKEITLNESERVLIVHHTGTEKNLGKAYRFREQVNDIFKGIASFYGYDGSGNKTASGEKFNPEAMTAAHRTLPFGTRVRVTNPHNGRSVIVRINDRGPFIHGRVIDLSYGAARILGIIRRGITPVKVQIMGR